MQSHIKTKGESWAVVSEEALAVHRWSDRALVYNDLTGHTHLLDEMTTVAFEHLLAGPMTEDALLNRLGAILGLTSDPALEKWLRQALVQLERLGLIASERPEDKS